MSEINITKPTDRFLLDRREPSIGRTVHYVLFPGEHRPATVLRIHDDNSLSLMVTLDGLNDTRRLNESSHIVGFQFWVPDAKEDPAGFALGSWHWPETWQIPGVERQ
jgi:hypothetical protein